MPFGHDFAQVPSLWSTVEFEQILQRIVEAEVSKLEKIVVMKLMHRF